MQEQEEEEGEEEEEQREKVGKQTERDEDGWTYLHLVVWTYARLKVSDQLLTLLIYYAPAVGGIKRYRDPSVCLFQPRLWHAGCVAQLPRLSAH